MKEYQKTHMTSSPSLVLREKAKSYPEPSIRYSDLFWLFLFGSFLGFLLEGLWSRALYGAWANHSATVWGPFCIVYGLGVAVMHVLSFSLHERSFFVQFPIYALVGSLLEFWAGLFQELFFGATSWDYSDQWLNVDGRVSLRMALVWGILGLSYSLLLFLPVERWLARTRSPRWHIACGALSVLMAANLALTAAAVHRWHERMEGCPPTGEWEVYLDRVYDDTTMREIFPNMIFQSKPRVERVVCTGPSRA